MYDVAVIGGGPAGLSATINSASEGMRTVCLADKLGGQAGDSSLLENYMGFAFGISGAELTRQAHMQARKFGAELYDRVHVAGIESANGVHTVKTGDGSEVQARTVILATGGRYHCLPAANGHGPVHYRATHQEEALCDGVPVMVVGGGNSSGQAAMYLSNVADRVYLAVRNGDIAAGMSRYLIDRLERRPNVELLPHMEVSALHGDQDALQRVEMVDNRNGVIRPYACERLFVMIGSRPDTCYLPSDVCTGIGGYINTGDGYATSAPGIFAVGDVRNGSVKRCAVAAGEGAAVVPAVWRYLNS